MIYKLSKFFLLLAITYPLISCGKKNKSKKSDDSEITAGQNNDKKAGPKVDETALNLAQVDVGFKNFMQINATFSALTGVATTDATITKEFVKLKEQLATDNNIKTFSASIQVAVSRLAMEYCTILVNTPELSNSKIPNFKANDSVKTALNTEGENALISGLLNSFWKNSAKANEIENAKNILETLVTDLKAEIEEGDATKTKAIAAGTCAAVLSSSPVTTL